MGSGHLPGQTGMSPHLPMTTRPVVGFPGAGERIGVPWNLSDSGTQLGGHERRSYSPSFGHETPTGAGLYAHPPEAQVVAVDGAAGMLAWAERRAARLGAKVEFVCDDLHALPFPDTSFDYVVGSFVLCTVRKPLGALGNWRGCCGRGAQAP